MGGIHDERVKTSIYENGITYVLVGDYYFPALKVTDESRPIGRWGRLHRQYLQDYRPAVYQSMTLNEKIWTYLADLNEQAENRLELIIKQMKAAEGVTEEIIKSELIFV